MKKVREEQQQTIKKHIRKDNIQVDKVIHIKDSVVLKKVQELNQVHTNQAVPNFTKDKKNKVEAQGYRKAQKQLTIKEKDLKGINDL